MLLNSINIELSALCGYRCIGCPNTFMRRPKGHMEPALAVRLIKEGIQYCSNIYLWNYGEPLLHPELSSIIYQCGQATRSCVISTTAGHIHPATSLDCLTELRQLIVSLNGLDEETYALHQDGASLGQVLTNLERLAIVCKNKEVDYTLQFVIHKNNVHQIKDVPQFAQRYGFRRVTYKTFSVMDESDDTFNDFVPKIPSLSRYESQGLAASRNIRPVRPPCLASVTINWNGDVIPCCWDYQSEIILGNVGKMGIGEFLKSQRCVQHMHQIRNLQFYQFCHRCALRRQIKGSELAMLEH